MEYRVRQGKKKNFHNVNIRLENDIFGTNNSKIDFTIQRDFRKSAREKSENRIDSKLRVVIVNRRVYPHSSVEKEMKNISTQI
jgi:hypothetical protein